MLRSIKQGIVCIALVLASAMVLRAQQQGNAPAAPVPEQISAAKKVFISNGGGDAVSADFFKSQGNPNKLYDEFYAAMKSWGRYELVAVPANADLVFEINFAVPIVNGGEYEPPLFRLAIIDPKTRITLWSIAEPVRGAIRKRIWNKNFAQGMTNLMADIKKLAGQTAATALGK